MRALTDPGSGDAWGDTAPVPSASPRMRSTARRPPRPSADPIWTRRPAGRWRSDH